MTTVTLRTVKGSPLTHAEVDANFDNLNKYKVEQDANGNAIVGSGSPVNFGVSLTIRNGGTGSAQMYLQNSTSGSTATDGGILQFAGGSGLYLWNFENLPVIFGENNTEAARITGGYFAVGTTSPSGKLHVKGVSGTTVIVDGSSTTTGAINTGAQMAFYGHDGVSVAAWAQIAGLKENATSGDRASYLALYSRPSGGNLTERFRVDSAGNSLATNSIGLGYGAGSGGTVTQATSKSTAVTLNKPSGRVTMNNDALAAGAVVTFQLVNSAIVSTDTPVVAIRGGQTTMGTYRVWVEKVGDGWCYISVENRSAGSLSEALELNFNILKGSAT